MSLKIIGLYMPNISVTLPENTQSIFRPVILDIVSQIQEITKIPKDSLVTFPGDTGRAQTPGSDIESNGDRSAQFNSIRRCYIEVEENDDIESIGTTIVSRPEHIPVFMDKRLGVYITPVYSTTNLVISFKYRCPSKTEATRWRDDIRMRVSQLRDINLHDLTYHYPLPVDLLIILKAIYDKRENVAAYGQTFQEYLHENSTERLTLIGDLVNDNARLAVSEKQCRIVGIFNWDTIPDKPNREEDTGTYTVDFSYKLSFERPIACNMKYPVIIHNQLLPPAFTEFTNKSYDLDKVSMTFSNSLGALRAFEYDTIMRTRLTPDFIVRIPEFDDYNLPNVPVGTGTVLIALTEVDADKRTLLNLNELGDIVLDEDIIDFIKKGEYRHITNIFKSIIFISLYRNNDLCSNNSLICDSNLNIKATADLDLRDQHRIRISIMADLTLLKKESIDRLKEYPKATVKIIGSINELLKNHPDFNNLGDKASISNLELGAIYKFITGYSYDSGHGVGKGHYYGEGRNISNWPYSGYVGANSFLTDIDPRVVENYRRNRISAKTVQISGIIASLRNR